MINVVIADDVQILRQGLKAILEQDAGIRVTGLAANGHEAWQLARTLKPDVVLMDMRMPEFNGSYGISRIKEEFPDMRVLVLTTFDDRETIDAALASGADGYILKEMEDEKVIQSVKAICAGVRVFGGSIFDEMRKQMTMHGFKSDLADTLTARERDIIRLVARGMDNKEIAGELFLAEGTVRNNISRLLDKLKLKDRTQMAVFAVKNDLDI